MQDCEYVSLPQAAKELGVSRATAYTWALAGRIPAKLIAGRYAVSREQLDAVKPALRRTPRRTYVEAGR